MTKHLVRGAIALTAAAALGLGLSGCSKYAGPTSECRVTGKYTAIVDKDTQKRVETSCGVFTADDDPFHGVWDSADIYARIQVNKTYDFTAYGQRNPFFSSFPNITTATEVTQ